jgi:hypothetical protein
MANELLNSEEKQSESPLKESTVIQSPFCGSLRSKKFFMLDALATSADQYLDGSNHCWCRETQQVIGPDNGRVQPDRCVPGRSCYSSAI